jgi:HlyD family secretion protein
MEAVEITSSAVSDAVDPLMRGRLAGTAGRSRWRIGVTVVLVAAAALTMRVLPRFLSTAADDVIAASGRIEGREITVAPKDVQGRVVRLLADEGDTVVADQRLAELDAKPVAAQHRASLAAVAALDAQIAQALLDVEYTAKSVAASAAAAEAALSAAQAGSVRARAVMDNARAVHARMAALYPAGAISRQELDVAEMTLRTSEADAMAADRQMARAEAELARTRVARDTVMLKQESARALQAQRRAALELVRETEAHLAELQVVAPNAGTVIARAVEVGDVVGPGTPLFQLVDMTRLYVKIYVPEASIGRIRLGDPADVVVDAFPGHRFAARVSKVHQQAEFTPKNVETSEERLKLVFGVELALENPDRLLKPGMPADCRIRWRGPSTEPARGF